MTRSRRSLLTPLLLGAFALVPTARAAAAPACGTENLLAGMTPVESVEASNDLRQLTDGAVAPEGAPWNAPVVVVLASHGSFVTYDLGGPREISALHLQGDANDVYRVSGSLDGTPGSFRPLAELPNVVASQGHGLRARGVEIAPTTVRYLRFGEATGDSFFSIAELGAYCRKPSPFPPRLRVVELPAPAAPPGDGRDPWPPFLYLYAIALGVLAWLAYVLTRPARAPRETASSPGDTGDRPVS